MIKFWTQISDPSVALLDDTLARKSFHADLAADDTNLIRAVTITLRPGLHKLPPREIRKHIVDETKNFIRKRKTPIYCELHWEFTKNMVLHAHGSIVCRSKHIIANLIALYRRIAGFVCIKTPHHYKNWLDYCSKEEVYRTNYFYNKKALRERPSDPR